MSDLCVSVGHEFQISSITIAIYSSIYKRQKSYFYAFFAFTLSQDSDADHFAYKWKKKTKMK